MNRQWMRAGLRWLLIVCAVSAVLAIVAAALQGALAAGGDLDGASAVRGVLMVAVTGTGLSILGLVVLLALLELDRE